jgi:hypothetical protein
MDAALRTGMPRNLRAFVSGVLVALAIAVLSLFAKATSAFAGDSESGLLGAGGSTVNGVTDTVGVVVEPVATTVVEPVTSAVATTVAEPVATVAEPVTSVAKGLMGGTVGTAADDVTAIASSGVVGAIVDPVVDTGVAVPIVGVVIEQVGVGGVVTGVAGTVDETFPVAVGTAPEITPVVPSLPGDGGEVRSPAPGVTGGTVTPPAIPSDTPVPAAPDTFAPAIEALAAPPAPVVSPAAAITRFQAP